MLDFLKHSSLVVGMLNLLHLDNLGLFQDLNSIVPLIVLRLNKMDSAETASAQCSLYSEVGECVFALGSPWLLCCRLLDASICAPGVVIEEVLYAWSGLLALGPRRRTVRSGR